MDLALYAVQAVLKEKRSRREVALAIGRSKSWVAKMVLAYEASGEAGLLPAKQGPKGPVATRTSAGVEDAIVQMRKMLDQDGLDAGASTIRYHLRRVARHHREQQFIEFWSPGDSSPLNHKSAHAARGSDSNPISQMEPGRPTFASGHSQTARRLPSLRSSTITHACS